MDTILHYIQLLLPYLFGAGGVFMSILDRKKLKAERKVREADALSEMQKTYATFIIDSKQKFEDMEAEIKELAEENRKLREQIQKFRTRLDS